MRIGATLCDGTAEPVLTTPVHGVFCASFADVFEDWDELDPWRDDPFQLIDATSQLDFKAAAKYRSGVAAPV